MAYGTLQERSAVYVKLFSSLYQGTLRGRSDEILVFTNLLAHADQHGIVDKHFKAISEETGLSKERVSAAIVSLESPDPESRSPDMDGCRIVRLDDHRIWGWKIVNYGKYRAIRNEEDRREQNRLAQERWRTRHVSTVSHGKPPSSQAEAEAYTEGKVKSTAAPSALSRFEEFWHLYPRKAAKPAAIKVWRKIPRDQVDAILKALEAFQFDADPKFQPHPATWLSQGRWHDQAVSYGTCKFCDKPATRMTKGTPHCETPRHIDHAQGRT